MKNVLLQIPRKVVEEKLLPKEHTKLPKLDTIKNYKLITKTGAAMYYKGGGWWYISGYSWDGDDVNALILEML